MRLYNLVVYILKHSLLFFNRKTLIYRVFLDMSNCVFSLEETFDHNSMPIADICNDIVKSAFRRFTSTLFSKNNLSLAFHRQHT
jgi:hypothetical protein